MALTGMRVAQRSGCALTVLGVRPHRHTQFVLRRYPQGLPEVLLGFDLDACCLAWDGENLWGSARSVRALRTASNLLDPTNRSRTMESRCLKYAQRGFAVQVPRIDAETANRRVWGARRAKGAAPNLLTLVRAHLEGTGQQPRRLWALPAHLLEGASDYSVHVPASAGYYEPPAPAAVGRVWEPHLVRGSLEDCLEADGPLGPVRWEEPKPFEGLRRGSFHPLPARGWSAGLYRQDLPAWLGGD